MSHKSLSFSSDQPPAQLSTTFQKLIIFLEHLGDGGLSTVSLQHIIIIASPSFVLVGFNHCTF